jgi:hypothetical protein
MKYCLKIFASHLRQSEIESDIIDLLQGRVPRTVFCRHYFMPSFNYKDGNDYLFGDAIDGGTGRGNIDNGDGGPDFDTCADIETVTNCEG